MRTLFFTLLFAMVVWCAKADQIDEVVTNLPDGWSSGMTPIINLPETASVEQLVPPVLHCSFLDDSIVDHKVIQSRQVSIPRSRILQHPFVDSYLAVQIQTKHGEKIMLLRYQPFVKGWWSRVYDAKSSA